VRPDDVAVQYRGLEPRRHLVVQLDQAVGVGVELLGVRRGCPLRGHPLGEQRHDVCVIGVQRLVQRGGDDAVTERHQRRLAEPGILERGLDVLHRRRHLDRAGVVLGLFRARIRGEVRQLAQREIDLHHAASGLPVLDVVDELVGQLGGRKMVQERDLGMQRGDHQRGGDLVTVVQDDAAHFPATHGQPGNLCIRPDLGAETAGRARDGLRDTPHPAFGVSPTAELPVPDVADGVVRHDVGGARLVRPGPRSDHAVDRERAFDLR
jgi:hypothetical protein